MKQRLSNIYHLGVKELISLWRDPVMVCLIVYSFTLAVRNGAKAAPGEVVRAPIAVVDEDHSQLSDRIIHAFFPPRFRYAQVISPDEMDRGLDAARYTFALDIPPDFERDVRAGRNPKVQLNIDATMMSQAFLGASYANTIVMNEVKSYLAGHNVVDNNPINLVTNYKFNPTQNPSWFGSIVQLVNQITMLAVILTGAALIREREHGTLEHLLVMPLQPIDIMAAKIWANGLVVLFASAVSVKLIIEGWLAMPIHGSITLFLLGVALHLFSVTALGILLGTVARTMPQMGLLMILVIVPLQMLSGGNTPFQSMPQFVQIIMHAAPTMWFVRFAQAILCRGAGFSVVWPSFLAELVLASIFLTVALSLFKKSMAAAA
jgi:ABC-2 type transport system permease protein